MADINPTIIISKRRIGVIHRAHAKLPAVLFFKQRTQPNIVLKYETYTKIAFA